MYDDCAMAIQQADAYFAALNPKPHFWTTDTTAIE